MKFYSKDPRVEGRGFESQQQTEEDFCQESPQLLLTSQTIFTFQC